MTEDPKAQKASGQLPDDDSRDTSDGRVHRPTAPIHTRELRALVTGMTHGSVVEGDPGAASGNMLCNDDHDQSRSTATGMPAVDPDNDSGVTPSTLNRVFADASEPFPIASDHDSSTSPEPVSEELTEVIQTIERLEQMEAWESALALCRRFASIFPDTPQFQALQEKIERGLKTPHADRVGDLEQVPVVAVSPSEITWQNLDNRAGFLLSRIDGVMSYGELLAVSGMSHDETMDIFNRLLELGLISVQSAEKC